MPPIAAHTPLASAASPPAGRAARSPEEAARQFESVLVRQFVDVMTRDLFKAGAEGGMLTGQADLQRDTLTSVLTEHLVASGSFGVADLMMRQWTREGQMPADAATPPATPSDLLQAPPAGVFLDAPSDAPPAFDSPPDLS